MRVLTVLVALAIGCGSSTPSSDTPRAQVSGAPRFCAYGGVGIVPDPLPAGYETQFAAIVVEIENDTGAPLTGVTVSGGGLIGEDGAPLASLQRLDHVVVIDQVEPTSETMGTFAVYLNPEGRPFDGTLPVGRTVLRARFSLDRAPVDSPDHCLLLLSAGAPLSIDVPLGGVWPTS